MNQKDRIEDLFKRFEQGFVLGPVAFWVCMINGKGDLHMSIHTKQAHYHMHVTPTGRIDITREGPRVEEHFAGVYEEAVRRAETGDSNWGTCKGG